MDIISLLQHEIHKESAAIAPQTSGLIEAAKRAIEEIERLRSTPPALSGQDRPSSETRT